MHIIKHLNFLQDCTCTCINTTKNGFVPHSIMYFYLKYNQYQFFIRNSWLEYVPHSYARHIRLIGSLTDIIDSTIPVRQVSVMKKKKAKKNPINSALYVWGNLNFFKIFSVESIDRIILIFGKSLHQKPVSQLKKVKLNFYEFFNFTDLKK